MERAEKLKILADAAKYDVSCASSGVTRAGTRDGLGHSDGHSICHSFTPDGRCISLLKILLTNHCIYDCLYCVNRVSSDLPRAYLSPAEIVELTLDFYRRNYIEGLFLSSGIYRSPDTTMEQLVEVVRTLRRQHRFGGYIHLKAIPGASERLIEEAGRWVDRLSANIELPTPHDLVALAPDKRVDLIEATMGQIQAGVQDAQARRQGAAPPPFAPAGQTTQMIVGATPSSDALILDTAARLYDGFGLRRVYYSAFSPFPGSDARLPLVPPPLLREHRLYQADWLIRLYGFRPAELVTSVDGHLPLHVDPKLAWALQHRERFPVDINRAPKEALLRVPGLGLRNVERILRIRRHHRLGLDDLRQLGVVLRRATPFLETASRPVDRRLLDRQDLAAQLTPPAQLELFAAAADATTGEL